MMPLSALGSLSTLCPFLSPRVSRGEIVFYSYFIGLEYCLDLSVSVVHHRRSALQAPRDKKSRISFFLTMAAPAPIDFTQVTTSKEIADCIANRMFGAPLATTAAIVGEAKTLQNRLTALKHAAASPTTRYIIYGLLKFCDEAEVNKVAQADWATIMAFDPALTANQQKMNIKDLTTLLAQLATAAGKMAAISDDVIKKQVTTADVITNAAPNHMAEIVTVLALGRKNAPETFTEVRVAALLALFANAAIDDIPSLTQGVNATAFTTAEFKLGERFKLAQIIQAEHGITPAWVESSSNSTAPQAQAQVTAVQAATTEKRKPMPPWEVASWSQFYEGSSTVFVIWLQSHIKEWHSQQPDRMAAKDDLIAMIQEAAEMHENIILQPNGDTTFPPALLYKAVERAVNAYRRTLLSHEDRSEVLGNLHAKTLDDFDKEALKVRNKRSTKPATDAASTRGGRGSRGRGRGGFPIVCHHCNGPHMINQCPNTGMPPAQGSKRYNEMMQYASQYNSQRGRGGRGGQLQIGAVLPQVTPQQYYPPQGNYQAPPS